MANLTSFQKTAVLLVLTPDRGLLTKALGLNLPLGEPFSLRMGGSPCSLVQLAGIHARGFDVCPSRGALASLLCPGGRVLESLALLFSSGC